MAGLRVLIVEDDAIIAMLLSETLVDMGHDVCAVASTEHDALHEARNHHPDLIMLDAGLQAGNGVDAMIAILRERFVPHVFVTGNAGSVRARMPGAVVIQKPFFLPELEDAIAAALQQIAAS